MQGVPPTRAYAVLLAMCVACVAVSVAGCLGSCGALYRDPIDLPAGDAANPVAVPLR